MPAIDDFNGDDEDWNDDDNQRDESDTSPCPECGEPVEYVANRCPACGYWILDADRRAMWVGTGNPIWIKVAAAIVLIAMLGGTLLAFF